MPATPMGRPSKLTPEVQDTICKYLRAGNAFKTACEAAGIGYATGKQWRQRGEDRHPDRESGEDRDPERPGDEAFAGFAAATRRDEAEALARCAMVVQKAAADGSVQAATWFLERRAPAEWGRVDRHVIARGEDEPQQPGSGLSVEQIKRRIVDLAVELGYVSLPGIGPGEVIEVEAQDVEPG